MKKFMFFLFISLSLVIIIAGKSYSTFYSSGISNSSLVLYFQFTNSTTNAAGNLVWDESGTGNNGTMTSMNNTGNATSGWNTTSSECRYGNCMIFDGINDYVNVPNSASLNTSTAFTATAWVYPFKANISVRGGIVENSIKDESGGTYSGWSLFWSSRFDLFVARTTGTLAQTQSPNLAANQWYFVAGVKNSTHIILYVNGDQYASSHTTDVRTNTNSIKSGTYYYWNPIDSRFNGTIDDVRIYNRTLSTDEIKELYSCRQPNNSPWTMTANCNIQNETVSDSAMSLEIVSKGNLTLTNTSLFVDQIVIANGGSLAADNNSKWGVS